MKRIKILITLLLVVLTSTLARAQFIKASLQAAGLTCSMCSKATQEALATLPFVQNISTDLNTNTFTLNFKKGLPVNMDAIKKKVEDAGFSVAKLVVTLDFDHVKIGEDTHINYEGNIIHFVNVKNQVLNGDRDITVIDRGFLPGKEFKKYLSAGVMSCYKSGRADDSCCKVDGKTNSDRVYHVTI